LEVVDQQSQHRRQDEEDPQQQLGSQAQTGHARSARTPVRLLAGLSLAVTTSGQEGGVDPTRLRQPARTGPHQRRLAIAGSLSTARYETDVLAIRLEKS